MKLLNDTLFENKDQRCFQQDSAPVYGVKIIQEWLAANVSFFMEHGDWPSSSSNLNSLDYKLWNVLEEVCYDHCHRNLGSSKKSIVKNGHCILLETFQTAIDNCCVVYLSVS